MVKHEKPGGFTEYSCKLQLPCNAPFETLEGPVCSSMRLAQQACYHFIKLIMASPQASIFFLGLILHLFPQAVCLAACKKLHETGAFTDMLLPDKGSGEDKEKIDQNDEGEPLPGTARHREFYPEGVADILRVSSSTNSEEIFNWYFSSGNIITNLM